MRKISSSTESTVPNSLHQEDICFRDLIKLQSYNQRVYRDMKSRTYIAGLPNALDEELGRNLLNHMFFGRLWDWQYIQNLHTAKRLAPVIAPCLDAD